MILPDAVTAVCEAHTLLVAEATEPVRIASAAAINLAQCRAPIPIAFWDELKHEALIAREAPT